MSDVPYSSFQLDPNHRTVSTVQMVGRICRRFGVSRATAHAEVMAAFDASSLTAVGRVGTDGRGRRTPRATEAEFGTWFAGLSL